MSRFSRNIVDCLHYIRLLAALDIGITFEKENIDTLDMGSETYLSIYSIFSQSESESISGNVTWGKHRSFMNGKVPMNYGSMLGYQREMCIRDSLKRRGRIYPSWSWDTGAWNFLLMRRSGGAL